jgi:hypothetical protein
MAEVARLGFTIVGYAIGGPWGALIGGFLGSALFPLPGVKGPRLNELTVQQSTVGAPIPIVYGTYALAGNVIWSGGLIETKHSKEVGGFLGIGGQDVTSYTYSIDMAIGICEGPISGIRRIWADADLIYDASDDATLEERFNLEDFLDTFADILTGIRAMSAQLDMEVYLGTEDQLPDPTIQAYENVNYVTNVVPAYRGLAYIVFHEFELEKFGNRIPNFRFEVYSGAPLPCGLYSPGVLHPWFRNERDPRNDDNMHFYAGPSTSYNAFHDNINEAIADGLSGYLPEPVNGWSTSPGTNFTENCTDWDTSDQIDVYLELNTLAGGFGYTCESIPNDPPEAGNAYDPTLRVIGELNMVYSGVQFPSTKRIWWFTPGFTSQEEANSFMGGGCPDGLSGGGASGTWEDDLWRRHCSQGSEQIRVVRSITPPSFMGLEWTQVIGGTFKCLQWYRTGTASYRPGQVISYPCGPCLRSDDLNYNNQAYWEAAYAAALADGALLNSVDGSIPDDWVYGVDYPGGPFVADSNNDYIWQLSCDAVETDCVPMAAIVADICRRAGLRIIDG